MAHLEIVVRVFDVVEGQAELTRVFVVFLPETVNGEVALDDFVGLVLAVQELQVELGGL